jgi:hypothetical protein
VFIRVHPWLMNSYGLHRMLEGRRLKGCEEAGKSFNSGPDWRTAGRVP